MNPRPPEVPTAILSWSIDRSPYAREMKCLAPVFLSLAFLASLVSCAVAPARLERIRNLVQPNAKIDDRRLIHLLDQALYPTEPEAAKAALGEFVETWRVLHRDKAAALLIRPGHPQTGPHYDVMFEASHLGSYLPSYFDEINDASAYRVRKLKHYQREGIGTPLVALRENHQASPLEVYYPPEAITRPLTAVAESQPPQGGMQRVKIGLHCPLFQDAIQYGETSLPLAADFTVPWARLLARSGDLNRLKLTDAIARRIPKRETRLYLMENYDPRKEPLIMIHGLFSSPLAWAKVSNALWADDTIRRRYQIWHFLYNTSAPALYSGRQLRTQLRELRKLLDPSGRHPAMQSTTVLAHSMGGIVARSLISRPGNAFWDRAITVPLSELTLSDSDRAKLQEAFFWEPEHHVKRVIFVAVPHRGSDFADNFLGRLGRWLVAPPNHFGEFYQRISEANPGVFTEEYAALGRGELDSVSALSPRQPTLQILAGLPLSHPVEQHSIIGDRGRAGPLEESSDGVVPYWSSHLPGAISEKIIPDSHSAYDHPETIAEIKRILKLPRR